MASNNEQPTLDQEVFRLWDDLIARRDLALPMSRVEYREFLEAQGPEWDSLITKAFDGERWLVGNQITSTVSVSLWARAMGLGQYHQAQKCIERCLVHSDPFDDFEKMLLVVRWEAAQIAIAPDEIDPQTLLSLLESKHNDRGQYAMEIIHMLVALVEELGEDKLAAQEIQAVARAIAIAKQATTETVDSCADIQTWGDLKRILYQIARWTLPELSADSYLDKPDLGLRSVDGKPLSRDEIYDR